MPAASGTAAGTATGRQQAGRTQEAVVGTPGTVDIVDIGTAAAAVDTAVGDTAAVVDTAAVGGTAAAAAAPRTQMVEGLC